FPNSRQTNLHIFIFLTKFLYLLSYAYWFLVLIEEQSWNVLVVIPIITVIVSLAVTVELHWLKKKF
ncbi:MAG: hypothetical protein CL733_05265, partial [Chloroflexi bacterium]|nr:hypothetical protein [Chloroflexota bacterium]